MGNGYKIVYSTVHYIWNSPLYIHPIPPPQQSYNLGIYLVFPSWGFLKYTNIKLNSVPSLPAKALITLVAV